MAMIKKAIWGGCIGSVLGFAVITLGLILLAALAAD